MQNYTNDVEQLMSAIDSNWNALNIMILGLTGCGKSTLVNSVFGKEVAPVGAGKPVTKGIISYQSNTLTLYDTEGLEADAKQQLRITEEICATIQSLSHQGIEKQIHMIWYCFQATSRPQDIELTLLRQIAQCIREAKKNIPIVFVLTKPALVSEADFDKFEKSVKDDVSTIFPNCTENIVEVQAIPVAVGRGPARTILPAYGLDKLDECVRRLLPQAIQDTYTIHQRINLQAKVDKANRVLWTHYATAGSAIAGGATVAGVDDTWALIGMQLAMFAEIGSIFHFTFDENKIKAALAGSVGVGVASAAGKTIFRYALAAITGGLSIAPVAVARIVIADTVTISIGKAYIGLMRKFASGEITESQVAQEIESLLKTSHKQ